MERSQVIDNIRQVAASVLPKGSTLYLYGSRARGDYHEDSDWDLLVLLDKPKKEKGDLGQLRLALRRNGTRNERNSECLDLYKGQLV